MLRFDNLGLGDSQPGWGDGSFTTKVADTALAAEYLAGRGTPTDLLVGHSFGGAAVIAAAALLPRGACRGQHRRPCGAPPCQAPL
jgi:pimeloyl-ACP methyl ester carboxylesterase